MAVERVSRTQRDLQRLDGRRGPKDSHAVTWGEIDTLMAAIAARSKASSGKYVVSLGTDLGDLPGELGVDVIVSPTIGAPTGLTISSSVNEATGVSFIYVDWDDVEGASGYQLGFIIDGGGEFLVSAPTSFFQNSVIAGQTISVRVRSINSLNVPGPWSTYVNHVAQKDTTPPPVPTGLEITPAFNGFWIKWDKSPAADISRYDVYERASPTPAPSAATNPTFTSASPVFFRGSLPNGATRYYWIRAVDYSENASAWSARISATTVTDPGELLDLLEGEITESQLFSDLGDRIDLIDGPESMVGSVSWQVAAAYDNAIAAIEEEAEVRAEQTGDLFGQYTVKIDLNGYVSGFGLASQAPVDGTPSSQFLVRADTFAIANPSGPSVSPELPFIVRTSGTTIGGQYVPPGVYIRDGFIQNGTISNATIADATITDAKIQELSATKLISGTQIANNITVNGQALGTIKDNADNPAARINAASTNILPGKITLTGSATLLNWTASADRTQIDGGRIYTNSIEADSVDTTSLAADSAFITNLTSTGTSFMNQLLVRTANIENGAIKTAKIGDLEVDSAKIANLTVGTNKITGEAVTDSEVEVDTYYSLGAGDGLGWKEVLVVSPWVNPENYRLLLNISFRVDQSATTSIGETRWRLQFDNETVYQENQMDGWTVNDIYRTASVLVPNPGSGGKKTAFWWYKDTSTLTLRDIVITATRIKK